MQIVGMAQERVTCLVADDHELDALSTCPDEKIKRPRKGGGFIHPCPINIALHLSPNGLTTRLAQMVTHAHLRRRQVNWNKLALKRNAVKERVIADDSV